MPFVGCSWHAGWCSTSEQVQDSKAAAAFLLQHSWLTACTAARPSLLHALQLVNLGAQWIPQWGWRLSLGLAAMPATILIIGGLVLPESPSHLIEK